MRDEHVRRYARHILLPDMGGLGQTALMTATARITISRTPTADLIAGTYLAAGGVGTLVVNGATDDERAAIAKAGPDTHVLEAAGTGTGTEVTLPAPPSWWPAADGDATALAFWRGGYAATRWMADIASR